MSYKDTKFSQAVKLAMKLDIAIYEDAEDLYTQIIQNGYYWNSREQKWIQFFAHKNKASHIPEKL